MAGWTTTGSLKGPQGNPGVAGRGVATGQVQGDGTLLFTYSDSTSQNVGVVKGTNGTNGADGKSVTITGSVANAAALPTGLTAADAGKGWITQDDGHLHVWGGTVFNDVGVVKGPQGDQGTQGSPGNTGPRGSTIFNGHGAPGTVAGSLPGDMYLDVDSGNLYSLS